MKLTDSDCNVCISQTMPSTQEFKRLESEYDNIGAKGCCLQPVKYISLTEKIQQRIANHDRWYSLEFFPPRTSSGAVNLLGW